MNNKTFFLCISLLIASSLHSADRSENKKSLPAITPAAATLISAEVKNLPAARAADCAARPEVDHRANCVAAMQSAFLVSFEQRLK